MAEGVTWSPYRFLWQRREPVSTIALSLPWERFFSFPLSCLLSCFFALFLPLFPPYAGVFLFFVLPRPCSSYLFLLGMCVLLLGALLSPCVICVICILFSFQNSFFICLFVLIFWFGSCRCVLVPSTLSISLALPINLRFILFLFFFSVSQSVTTEFVSL